MIAEEREDYLLLCSYMEMIIRLKSERVVGGCSHTVTSVGKVSHDRGVNQIKQKTI